MGLNVSKGNMYDFVTHTWNTIKGKCPHDCSYCYMKKWGHLKDVRFDKKEFMQFERDIIEFGDDLDIFVGSSCDMFAETVNPKWIIETLLFLEQFDSRIFLQSKNPKAFSDYGANIAAIKNISLCTTIETNRVYDNIMNWCPSPHQRALELAKIPIKEKYVTIEPIMDFDIINLITMLKPINPIQINIGADSGGHKLPEPPKEKILELITELEKFTNVKQKSNLKRLLK